MVVSNSMEIPGIPVAKKTLWEKIKFTCQKTCGAPPEIPNAKIVHSEEESVTYHCLTNSTLNTPLVIKCLGIEWELPESQCSNELMAEGGTSISSPDTVTQDKMNTTVDPENATVCENSNDGKLICTVRNQVTESNNNNLCIDGFISGTNDSCISNNSENCPEPIDFPNTIIERGIEGNVIYTCQPGYIQEGNISTSFCENGTWTEIKMTCLPENFGNCPEPMDFPNTIMERDIEGNFIYTCQPGYIQEGNISSSFCENGTWTEIDMTCLPESCGPLDNVTDSVVTFDGNTANFTCKEGFIQEGNISVSICENGTWSEINTICVVKVAVSKEYRERQESKEFQENLENSDKLICSFDNGEQICRCNNKFAKMELTSNRMIAGHNYLRFRSPSLEMCEISCLGDESCLSLEYDDSIKVCHLSKTASYLVESLIFQEMEGVIYGEKVCGDQNNENYALKDVGMERESFNLSTVPLSALLCSVSPERIFCGCVDGRISFSTIQNKKILMHNILSFRTNERSECFDRCRYTQNCLSAEFKYKRVCHLSQTARYLADKHIFRFSPNTIYLEKLCEPFDRNQTDIAYGDDILRV